MLPETSVFLPVIWLLYAGILQREYSGCLRLKKYSQTPYFHLVLWNEVAYFPVIQMTLQYLQ